jgi:hypothetical protein
MDQPKKRVLLPAPVAAFIVAHLVVLALTWAVASLVSKSHPELSPQSVPMRLVPLDASK